MTVVNGILNRLFGLVMAPLDEVGPWPGMVLLSLLAGVVILLIFKVTSNPKAIERKKNRLLARVLELVIFRHDIVVNLGAFGRVVGATGVYLARMIVPLLASIVPLILVLAQVAAWFAGRPFQPGESSLVTAHLRDDMPVMEQTLSIESSPGVTVETAAVRVPSENEVSWRIRIKETGDQWVDVVVNGTKVRKQVAAAEHLVMISGSRERGFWAALLYPAEAPLPADGPLTELEIPHAESEFEIAGVRLHWLLVFFVISLVCGYALKKPFGVEI